jgi:cytochrome c5
MWRWPFVLRHTGTIMSHHVDPVEENLETHPVKLAIAVTAGAIGLVVGIILLAYFAVGTHKVGGTEANANSPEAIVKRIAPLTDVEFGKEGAAATTASLTPPTPSTPAALAPAVAAAKSADVGEATYKSACAACHATGVAGAPKVGDKAAWSARVAKGKATLYTHSIKGFNAMPAKGGQSALPDADVKAAVDYMVAQSK